MDNQNFLLTYDCLEYKGDINFISSHYAWFANEDDMNEFVELMKSRNKEFSINDAIEIKSCRPIEF